MTAVRKSQTMLLHNLRNSGDPVYKSWADAITNHPWAHIFFVGVLLGRYYQPTSTDHESVRAARQHAVIATLAHMDSGMNAINLNR